jgi:CubicO group peptidase (beta-lactamase class C family)
MTRTTMFAALVLATIGAPDRIDAAELTKAGLDALDADMAALVSEGHRAGVVYGVMQHGKLVALAAHGKRDLASGEPMTPDTVFRLYSQSRAVTAAAILTLVDEGRLRLDDPVAKYLPEIGTMRVIRRLSAGRVVETVPQNPAMTVRHLFQYTAGLGYAPDWPKSAGINQREILALDQDLAAMVRKLAQYPLLEQPGSKWRYGYSSDVLGRVAEVVSAKPFNEFLRERLTGPLKMPDTDFWMPAGQSARIATVYGRAGKGGLRVVDAVPSSTYDRPGALFSAGGGLLSTVPDYLRFGQMLLSRGSLDGVRILQSSTVDRMTTNTLTPAMGGEVNAYREDWNSIFRGYGWGLAIGVRLPERAHTVPGSARDVGWGGLASTGYFIDYENQIVAVVMSQYLGPEGDRPAYLLREGVYRALRTAPVR